MRRWAYLRVVAQPAHLAKPGWLRMLNDLGAQGWELICVLPFDEPSGGIGYLLFKREATDGDE